MKHIWLLLVLTLFLTGCSGGPFIVFSSQPVTQNTQPEYKFPVGERMYYAVVNQKGFKDKVIKVQIFKKDEKSDFWGYSYVYNRTCELTNDKFYTDFIVFHTKGHYAMQVFYLSDMQSPIIIADFWVYEK